MEKTCVVCGETFWAERVTAVFCSDTCKKKHQRKLAGHGASLAGQTEVVSGTKTLAGQVSGTTSYLDVVKDLGMSLEKDLGIFGMTPDGIFIRDDITESQVRNIRRVVEAKRGWVPRVYLDGGAKMSTISRCSQRV